MKGIFLILINIIIIFCSDEINTNLRYLNENSYSSTINKSVPGTPIDKSIPGTPINKSVPGTPIDKSIPGTPINKSIPGTTINKSVPGTPIIKSVPGTTINKSVPGTPIIKSVPGTTINKSIPGTPINKSIPGTTINKSVLSTLSSSIFTPTSTSPNNATNFESEPEKILLGVDNYKFENHIIFFYAKFLIESRKKFNDIEIFILAINNNNLRFLQNTPINVACYYEKNISTIYEYHCNHSYDGNIDSIKVSYDGDKTDYAVYSLENLQKQTGDKISLDLIHINDCTIVDEDNAIINGNSEDKSIPNNANSIMYVLIDGSTQNVSTNFIKKDDNGNYDLKLNLKQSLSTDLNNKLGVVEINGENKNYLLSFKDGEKSNLDYKYDSPNNTTNQVFYPKKSSGGLSGGTIVAIILPCIAALLAVLGLAFFLGKSSTGAAAASTIPMENIGNNTIGVTSSANVVNKYP